MADYICGVCVGVIRVEGAAVCVVEAVGGAIRTGSDLESGDLRS